MRNSFDVIDIDNYVILNILLNFHFQEESILVHKFGLKYVERNICKIFKTYINLITKYLNLNWNIVKSFIFLPKKLLILNQNFENYYRFQIDAVCSI